MHDVNVRSHKSPLSAPSVSTGTFLKHNRRLSNTVDVRDADHCAHRMAHSITDSFSLVVPSRRPHFIPSSIVRCEPRNITSNATRTPHSRDNRCVPPAPGINPMRTSGSPYRTVESAIRYCAHNASSSPPPRHAPVKATTTGLCDCSTRVHKSRKDGTATVVAMSSLAVVVVVVPENSRMSAPALKLPMPRSQLKHKDPCLECLS
jgi:hypothetical protein